MKPAASKIINRLMTNYQTFEKSANRFPEIIAMILYVGLVSFVSSFHEPWFDEAQAWMIARSASIWDIFTKIPHYEGHTPIWHLILFPLARSGVPYEFGLKSVSIIIYIVTTGLILFKAPFPRLVRMILPFTYFMFYQYGVISRNYSLMMLAFILTAIAYKTRNTKPVRFVFCLALLSAASSYGIVISAGIALTWLIEIWDRQPGKLFVGRFLRDKRFYSMAGLMVYNVGLVWMIVPYDDTMAATLQKTNNIFFRFAYMMIIAPIDSVMYQSTMRYDLLGNLQLLPTNLIAGLGFGLICNALLIYFAYRCKKLIILVLPYLLFSIFSSLVYFNTHHLGIVAFNILFWLWICLEQPANEYRPIPQFLLKISDQGRELRKFRKLIILIIGVSLAVSVYWAVSSSVRDIREKYGYGREAADFIKDHGLDRMQIMVSWKIIADQQTGEEIEDTNMVMGVDILPYFSHNIISNLNSGNDQYPYLLHIIADNDYTYQIWQEQGIPDVLISYPDLNRVFGSSISINNYVAVKKLITAKIWKDQIDATWIFIFIRKDLMYMFPELGEVPYEPAFSFN